MSHSSLFNISYFIFPGFPFILISPVFIPILMFSVLWCFPFPRGLMSVTDDLKAGFVLILLILVFPRTVARFESTPVCETVSFEVLRHLQRLMKGKSSAKLFAVRSSAVGEDSEEMSAAGQNASMLGVHGELSDILEAVQKCWGSLYTFQSVQYRR